jgi:hypothetical protein
MVYLYKKKTADLPYSLFGFRRNLMIKKGLFYASLVSVSLALVSCASYIKSITKVWDETLPESEMAMISLSGEITSYNGVAIEKGYKIMKIPAGRANFIINAEFLYRGDVYKAANMEFDFTFEAGKVYMAAGNFRSDDKDDEVIGVDIYVWDSLEDVSQKDRKRSSEHYMAFVPFKYQPDGWKRSYF